MDDVNSANDSATVITKTLGINHPKTRPTCPPLMSPNCKVDDTDAMTAIIEKANAIVSKSENSRRNSLLYPVTE